MLRVEWKVGDVDVTCGAEDATWLPVQHPIIAEKNSDALKVGDQFISPEAGEAKDM